MAKSNLYPNPHFFIFLLLLSLLTVASSISDLDLSSAIASLQYQNRHVIAETLAASELGFDLLLSNQSFTLFAPTDAALLSLVASASEADLVASVRSHVALGRLDVPGLRSLPDPSTLRTLQPDREILVSRRRSAGSDLITVDGVDVVRSGFFYGPDLAIHGLDGILPPKSSPDPRPVIGFPANLSLLEEVVAVARISPARTSSDEEMSLSCASCSERAKVGKCTECRRLRFEIQERLEIDEL